ncbi:MAG TPA: alpha-amylase/4-alpha-glucanotransferase domain-containing protein [Candidatus Kapabacteria bacterium]
MKSVNFCFGTHNHQPIGNFDYVIEEAYEKSYLPFFKLAAKYDVKFATHFSGILLDWLEKNHPEQLALLKKMVASGQLEIISGGYYEPILAVIPDRDKHEQVTRLTSRIKELLGYDASGLWLAERVWEQQLVQPLQRANINYVILDDTHFRAAGLEESDLSGYYLTEDNGKDVAVFPISKALRYTIPFSPVDETLKVLRETASEDGNNIVTFADDGEKFGVWPRTYDHVYKEGWLKEFFAKIAENRSWIKTLHFSEAVKSLKPKGRIYLPNASYAEMMQWALPTAKANLKYEHFSHALADEPQKWEEYMQFVRGGYWRNFFVKYPESDHLHKRMLAVSEKYSDTTNEGYTHLLASQCNDVLWHGVFGGIYLPNLRHEVYANLIKAESSLEQPVTEISGNNITLRSNRLALRFDKSRGGAITEIDVLPKAFNISNFINRIPEAYHEKVKFATTAAKAVKTSSIHDAILAKEEGLEKYLVYDWYKHGSFIEHFISKTTTLEDLVSMNFLEFGGFSQIEAAPIIRETDDTVDIEFTLDGKVYQNGISLPVGLKKKLSTSFTSNTLDITYIITNNSPETLAMRFASEWTFGLLAGDAHDRYYRSPNVKLSKINKQLRSSGEIKSATELSLIDQWSGIHIDIKTEDEATFWRTPIETVASSEAGFERVYQGSIVLPFWDTVIEPAFSKEIRLSITITSQELPSK